MTTKKFTREAFDRFLESVIQSQTVVGVQAKGDCFDYGPLRCPADLRLDYDVTLQSPKAFVLPPRETLMTYRVGGAYQSFQQADPLVLMGVHPYDVVAIAQMDRLFSQDNPDVHYLQRRRQLTIVACDVVNPSKNVFASSMGTAVVKEGFDVLLTVVPDGIIAEVGSEKGQRLLSVAGELPDATAADLKSREQIWQRNRKSLNQHPLKCDPSYLPKLLDKTYDHPIWEDRAKTCFSCGSCNLVCPTCYCFDVQDDVDWDLQQGRRERCWDGCLLDGFTKVAGDHEFRAARADRFRHRLYRKAKYVPQKIGGQIACVGCGRCIGACLPDIANPVAVYNQLLDEIGIR